MNLSTPTEPLPPNAAVLSIDPGAAPALPELLTEAERVDLAAHEATIQKGLQTFFDVGMAMAAIRDRRLYRAEFRTFEDYCQEKWCMTARRARQLWAAAEVVRALGNNGSDFLLPATESQARPLTWLPESDRKPAWDEAIKTAPAGKVTAKHVESVVRARLGGGAAAPAGQSQTVDGAPAIVKRSRSEGKIRAAAKAIAAARELEMELGTADSAVTAQVKMAVEAFEKIVAHLSRVEQMRPA
jgi:hypothetical protein